MSFISNKDAVLGLYSSSSFHCLPPVAIQHGQKQTFYEFDIRSLNVLVVLRARGTVFLEYIRSCIIVPL